VDVRLLVIMQVWKKVLGSVCTASYHVKKNASVMAGEEDECMCLAKKGCRDKL
jgi:hypothetical protein